MEINNDEKDFLDVDTPIPGQNYVCLSFISPEKTLKQKERFFTRKFLKSLISSDVKLEEIGNIDEKFEDFVSMYSTKLEEEFHKESGFQTSVRGMKVRGVYNTYDEAERRAKMLQQLDRSFHVFVAQVGYWLPWDPSADNIENQEYLEKELNELMKNYKNNQIERDVFYAKQVEEHKRTAAEAVKNKKPRLQCRLLLRKVLRKVLKKAKVLKLFQVHKNDLKTSTLL